MTRVASETLGIGQDAGGIPLRDQSEGVERDGQADDGAQQRQGDQPAQRLARTQDQADGGKQAQCQRQPQRRDVVHVGGRTAGQRQQDQVGGSRLLPRPSARGRSRPERAKWRWRWGGRPSHHVDEQGQHGSEQHRDQAGVIASKDLPRQEKRTQASDDGEESDDVDRVEG
ncbi:MAG: hypothetical protein IPK19_29090 [Chloroflexi bacterium]|nr:hypothetical protein [Chloroflexota bacterium]